MYVCILHTHTNTHTHYIYFCAQQHGSMFSTVSVIKKILILCEKKNINIKKKLHIPWCATSMEACLPPCPS